MVELIIEESGFPKDFPALQNMHLEYKKPLDELLQLLPGNRVLSGFDITYDGATMTNTEGLILFHGKIYTVYARIGSIQTFISFFSETTQKSFNIGTYANPDYANRDFKITRTAQLGGIVDNEGVILIKSLHRGRKSLEYLKSGTTVFGDIVLTSNVFGIEVAFPDVHTSDYIVIGNFKPVDPEVEFTESFDWVFQSKTQTSFKVLIRNAVVGTPALKLDWALVAINRNTPETYI